MSYTVKNAERKEKRSFNKVFGNDILKYLTEIITNSDDSYNRLEAEGKIDSDTICPIYIHVINTRANKEVYVVDNAEGMDDHDIRKNFEFYGADTSGGSAGKKVRGLFGQGATDVLFNASLHGKRAEIDSFKNGDFYNCKFRWEGADKKFNPVKPKLSQSQLREIRSHYRIQGNGTIVRFGLPDQVSIPRNLSQAISNFYMLRFVLNKPNREVILIEQTTGKKEESRLSYEFPPKDPTTSLLKKNFEFNFEGTPIVGELEIESVAHKGDSDLRVLVFDEDNSIYDNTLFGYENYPNSDNVHGYLRLTGSSKIIREKLNQDPPEEILTETRDGMDKRHSFYKQLLAEVEPSLKIVLEKLSKEKKEKSVELSDQKEWKDAFKEINKYFEEELEEEIGGVDNGTNPPSDGLRFLNSSIKLTAGKNYSAKLLINTKLLPVGSEINIANSSDSIEINPATITVSNNDGNEDGLAVKSISIKGYEVGAKATVTASYKGFSTKLFIEVIDKEIHYPKYGIEFWPPNISANTESHLIAKLYVDINKFPFDSIVKIDNDEAYISPDEQMFIISEDNLITDEIARIDIGLTTKESVGKAKLVAKINDSETTLFVSITDSNTPPKDQGNSGFLAGVTIKGDPQFWQTFYDKRDGYININSENNVNKLHLPYINPDNFKPDKSQRKYLAELCANEAAKQLVKKKIEKGKIQYNDYESVLDEIQKEKNKLLDIFVKSLDSFIA